MTRPEQATIGFIGLGVMGRHMAGHLQQAGHPLHVHNRTQSKANPLLEAGATWHETSADVAAAADVVISIVGFPTDVEEIYFGDRGILAALREGACAIDMTTSRPDLARRIAEAAQQRGAVALDAPVSGGDRGAREAKLSIMVGGDRGAFDRVRPLLEIIGANIVYQGPAGSGQYTKMANQIAIASNMLGVCEAVAYAREAGLDPETVLQSIAHGAAGSWSLSNLAPRMIADDFEPGFYVKHFIKDMAIAIDSAQKLGLDMPGLALAKRMYDRLAAAGNADLGTQALYTLYESSRTGGGGKAQGVS
jgi:3-hydroxyisobutyrate dehydrogenase